VPAKGAADQSSTNDSGPVDVEAASSPLKVAVTFSPRITADLSCPREVVNDCGRVRRWPLLAIRERRMGFGEAV
jgi:hypothetical protein